MRSLESLIVGTRLRSDAHTASTLWCQGRHTDQLFRKEQYFKQEFETADFLEFNYSFTRTPTKFQNANLTALLEENDRSNGDQPARDRPVGS